MEANSQEGREDDMMHIDKSLLKAQNRMKYAKIMALTALKA